jgi:hypothetical protein
MQLALATVGGLIGGPVGFLAGSLIGALIDRPKIRNEGPRLDDLRTQLSSYGLEIGFGYGTVREDCIVIWAEEKQEHKVTEHSGKGQPSITNVFYKYTQSFLCLIANRSSERILRIYMNKKLMYDETGEDGEIPESIVAAGGLKFKYFD